MKRFSDKSGRRAFTLVELIVVIGLMGMLATVSVAGYNAASQGMKNRAVMQDVTSLLRQAMQEAIIDHTTTAVLFYNRVLERGEATGFAVAIKQTGRLTMIKNNLFIDEFADWHQSFATSGTRRGNNSGSRVYRMQDENRLKSGLDQCSTFLDAFVTALPSDDYMIAAGRNIRDWVQDSAHKLTASDNARRSQTGNNNYANNYLWGRGFTEGNNLGWKPGDAYGVEFAQVQLPESYIFGGSLPSQLGLTPAAGTAAVVFNPDNEQSGGTITMPQNVTVSRVLDARVRDSWRIDNSMLKD